ncbi:MAG: 50S ribosomal protein L18 [Planctomycetota bacterium]
MRSTSIKTNRRERRRKAVRRRLGRPGPQVRLSVHRSSKHIYVQVIDDAQGKTICGVGTTAKRFAADLTGKSKTERAQFLGGEIARLAREKGVERVVFDRGFTKYHGRVKALAEAARQAGLKF